MSFARFLYHSFYKRYDNLKNALGLNEDSLVFMINTEGNTDPKHFRRIIWDGQDPVPKEYRTRR